MKQGILIVGSLNMDIVAEMETMPQKGETVLGKRLSYIPGGKGANQACAAGRLGGAPVLLGCVGRDSFGEKQLEELKKSHVQVTSIDVIEKEATGTALISVDGEGANCIVVVAGANAHCTKGYLEACDLWFQKSRYFMFQMEIPAQTVFYGIRRAKELGGITILNPAPAPESLPEDLWDKIDYITPNETELLKLVGLERITDENIRKGARRLLEKGAGNVLVTLGSRGALLVNQKEERLFPARKVSAVDTTAAGDCFNGAFVTALAEGMTREEAIVFANLASSVSVTRKGAQSSIPEREEVERLRRKVYSVCGANEAIEKNIYTGGKV